MSKRRYLIIGVVIAMVMIAGCTGGGSSGQATDGDSGSTEATDSGSNSGSSSSDSGGSSDGGSDGAEAQESSSGGSGSQLISVSSNPAPVDAGAKASITLTAAEGDYSEMKLEASNVPSELDVSFNPKNTVAPGESINFEMVENSGQPMQSYNLQIKGTTDSGESSTLDLTVRTTPSTC